VDSLRLAVAHKEPEPREEASPTGFVTVERGASRAILLTPAAIDPTRRYPLVTVLHGAGRQDELLVRACRDEPERRQALFLVPRSVQPTWDLIAGDERPDLDFLEWAYDLIYRRYPVDPERQALLGYSDGASYALSVGLSNPRLFRAVMGWAAGFAAIDDTNLAPDDPRPPVLLEYGTHDPLFPFERVALPMRAELERLGYRVEFRVDEGGRHWPSGTFQSEALDWFASEPWEPRA
jgi:phospholipase/carboxylesterase